HGIDHLEVAHLHAAAQMGAVRRLAHGFLASRHHDLGVAVEDGLVAERDRAQPRTAELVDAPGRTLDRNAGGDRSLAGRVLALAGGQDLTQNDLGDLRPLDVGALERLLDRDLPQFVGRKARKCPIEGADRRAGRSDDDDIVLHVVTPFGIRLDGVGNSPGYRAGPHEAAVVRHLRPHPWNVGAGLSIGRIAGLFCINCPRGAARGCGIGGAAAEIKRWPGSKKTGYAAQRIGANRAHPCPRNRSPSRNTPTAGSTTPAPVPTLRSKTSRPWRRRARISSFTTPRPARTSPAKSWRKSSSSKRTRRGKAFCPSPSCVSSSVSTATACRCWCRAISKSPSTRSPASRKNSASIWRRPSAAARSARS